MARTPPYINAFVARVIERAQLNLGVERRVNGKKRRAVATGTLQDNLTCKVENTPKGYTLRFGAKGKAKKYAMFVEFGRRAGKTPPPAAAIAKWIKQKPVRIRREGRIVKQTPKLIKQTAYKIAQKIGRDGIPALNYYKDAVADAREEMAQSIARDAIKDLISKRFGKNIK